VWPPAAQRQRPFQRAGSGAGRAASERIGRELGGGQQAAGSRAPATLCRWAAQVRSYQVCRWAEGRPRAPPRAGERAAARRPDGAAFVAPPREASAASEAGEAAALGLPRITFNPKVATFNFQP